MFGAERVLMGGIETAPSHHTLDQIETSKEFIALVESMRKKHMDAQGNDQIQNYTVPLINTKL